MKQYLLFTIGAAAVLALGLTARLQVNDSAYTAHEWGTFTSIQGSDGEPIRWNPFQTSDLPGFVFDRTRPTHNEELLRTQGQEFKTLGLKQSRDFLQRMETPVIYFRSDQALDVDVLVRFPKGLLTEWFPQVTTFGPVSGVPNLLPESKESHLKWSRVHILPPSASTNESILAPVPNESTPSHYYPARATAANLVETTRPFDSARTASVNGAANVREQLLFYRGAGDFKSPLRVSFDPSSQLRLENRGHETIGPIFAVHTTNGRTAFTALARLKGLRGTRFDPFGRTEERRMERRLITDFEATVEEVLAQLSPATHSIAVDLALVPQKIRGYGHVKEKSVAEAKAREAELMARLLDPAPKASAAD